MKIRFFYIWMFFAGTLFAQAVSQQMLQNMTSTAQLLEGDGQLDNALELYLQACHLKPNYLNAYLGAKRILQRKQDYDQLEALILSLQAANPDYHFEIDLGTIEYKRGEEKQALARWNKLIKENPQEHVVFSLIGREMLDLRLLDEAADVYLQGRKNLQNPTLYTLELAAIYAMQEKYKLLLQEYLGFLSKNNLQINFVESELDRLCNDESIRPRLFFALENLYKEKAEPQWAILLFMGNVQVEMSNFALALNYYQQFENMLHDASLNLDLRNYSPGKYIYNVGLVALQAGDLDVAEQALQSASEQFPKSIYYNEAQLSLSRVYTRQKNYDKAIRFLNAYSEKQPASLQAQQALMEIGDIYFQELWQVDYAIATYQTILQRPNNRIRNTVLFKLSQCYIVKNQLADAADVLDEIMQKTTRQKTSEFFQASYDLAQLDFYRGRPLTSLNKIRHVLSDENSEFLPADIENDALEFSMLLTENIFDSTALAALGQAKLLSVQKNYTAGNAVIDSFLNKHPFTSLQDEMQLLAAQNFTALSLPDSAVARYQQLYKNENSLYRDRALFEMATLYEQQENIALAVENYTKILVEFPASLYIAPARQEIRKLEVN